MHKKIKKYILTIFIIFLILNLIFKTKYIFDNGDKYFKSSNSKTDIVTNSNDLQIVDEKESKTPDSKTKNKSLETAKPTNYVSPIDFEKYKNVNSDTIAWLKIPNTNIDYPIVQTTDNDKYLYENFDGEKSIEGSIYLDYESKSDFTSWNNLLYGHNMKNGTMFKDIVKFKDKNFFNKNRKIFIYTPNKTIELITISAFYDTASNSTRKNDFKNQNELYSFVKEKISKCSYSKYPDFEYNSIYIFVTCSYEFDNARTFLYAVEVEK